MLADATTREIKAVDSENQKNLLSDAWRMNQEHSPSYLIGRLIRKKEPNSKSSGTSSVQLPVPDQLVSDLTAKIRAQLQQEMDHKLDQKVRQMMKMLAKKNSYLKLDTMRALRNQLKCPMEMLVPD